MHFSLPFPRRKSYWAVVVQVEVVVDVAAAVVDGKYSHSFVLESIYNEFWHFNKH